MEGDGGGGGIIRGRVRFQIATRAPFQLITTLSFGLVSILHRLYDTVDDPDRIG
jgi:hypothetical protein